MSIAKQKPTKYGSSPSLAGIEDVIAFFYAGERKLLVATGDKLWTVHRADGNQIAGVCVRFVKGRYVFEGLGDLWLKRYVDQEQS